MNMMQNLFRFQAIVCVLLLLAPIDAFPASVKKGLENNPITKRVDRLFAEWNQRNTPGVGVAIIQSGQVIYKRGYGLANLEHGVPITPTTVFNIASVSRQFTAMAIVMLTEQGEISMEDDYRLYLPEMPDLGGPITIQHLLNHKSGMRSWTSLLLIAGWKNLEDTISAEQVYEVIRSQKGLDFKPGESFRYSNSGYFLLAKVVERVTGVPFADWLEMNIFKPIGMDRTFCKSNYKTVIPGRASSYSKNDQGYYQNEFDLSESYGSGNIYSTVEDMAI